MVVWWSVREMCVSCRRSIYQHLMDKKVPTLMEVWTLVSDHGIWRWLMRSAFGATERSQVQRMSCAREEASRSVPVLTARFKGPVVWRAWFCKQSLGELLGTRAHITQRQWTLAFSVSVNLVSDLARLSRETLILAHVDIDFFFLEMLILKQ
jgi:hypothetical protein